MSSTSVITKCPEEQSWWTARNRGQHTDWRFQHKLQVQLDSNCNQELTESHGLAAAEEPSESTTNSNMCLQLKVGEYEWYSVTTNTSGPASVCSTNRNYLLWCRTLTRGYKILAARLHTITRSKLTWQHKAINTADFRPARCATCYTDETLTLTNIPMTFMFTGLTYIHLKYMIQ